MRRTSAHKLLDKQLSAIGTLRQGHLGSPELSSWLRETRFLLKRIFGPATKHPDTLERVVVPPAVYTAGGGYDAAAEQRKYVRDLDQAATFLRLLKDEVTKDSTWWGKYRPPSNKVENDAIGKITVPWLLRHVPINIWLGAAGFILAVFVIGIRASKIDWIRQLFTNP